MLADPRIQRIPEVASETHEGILLRKMGTLNVAVASVCGNGYGFVRFAVTTRCPAKGRTAQMHCLVMRPSRR